MTQIQTAPALLPTLPKAGGNSFGAILLAPDLTRFTYPSTAQEISVVEISETEDTLVHRLERVDGMGIFTGEVPLKAGALYKLVVDGKVIPDPLSRYQPEGVTGPSMVVDSDFKWSPWSGLDPKSPLSIFELHVGTFGQTFNGCVEKLPYLKELGVGVIQIMPPQQCVGQRNWGYDPTHIYAPFHAYGTPQELKNLINKAHESGLGVIIDVVYNHLGPEGNALPILIPTLFTDRVKTPWGGAIDFAQRPVREFFIQNATYWLTEFQADGIRLDAAHQIHDELSPIHFLQELTTRIKDVKPNAIIIAEHEGNTPQVWSESEEGGFGLSHKYDDRMGIALRAILGDKKIGYYEKRAGMNAIDLAKLLSEIKDKSMVTFEHHDWVGNEHPFQSLSLSIPEEATRTALSILAFAPGAFMVFQGQEHGGGTLCYFCEALTPEIEEAVRKGRKKEFEHFFANVDDSPDPFAMDTFDNSRHNATAAGEEKGQRHFLFLKALLDQRRSPALQAPKANFSVRAINEDVVALIRTPSPGAVFSPAVFLASVRGAHKEIVLSDALPEFKGLLWDVVLSTAEGIPSNDAAIAISDGRVTFSGIGAVMLTPRQIPFSDFMFSIGSNA